MDEIRAAVAVTSPGQIATAMLDSAHQLAVLIKCGRYRGAGGTAGGMPLDCAPLFLKDTQLMSNAEWQSMSATRGAADDDIMTLADM